MLASALMTIAAPNALGTQRFLRTVFDAIPLPTFIVDDDVRIQDYNTAAAQLLGPEPELALHHRGGDALHCIHSTAKGCGQSEPCKDCVVRNSVNHAFAGLGTHRQMHKAELRTQGGTVPVDLLVTTTLLPDTDPPRALLILEDVSELLTLRGLIPICAQCKKIRDDQQYWHSLESYLHSHMNMKLTHGLCPTCFATQMEVIEAGRG
jgi:PAS domain-containing protein